MRVPRIFVGPEEWQGRETVRVTGTGAQHITRVLRLGAGAELVVLDGEGGAYQAEIRELTRDGFTAAITGTASVAGEPDLAITLVQGLPKGDKMDYVVQKATEVGVSRIIPLASERAVVRAREERTDKKRERWMRIATSAAEQAFRLVVPEILPVMTLPRVLDSIGPEAFILFPWEEERENPLKAVLRSHPVVQDIYIFIGPEGGFTEAEARTATDRGAHRVTLGPRILRTETAGPLVAALVLYEWGDHS
ncbi:MAG: 16S rRNA (uracil(1498)-N(3))-methyltransferase [Clostridia bacterium]|nr:16S rRNA (uracil(1498)-N(3))-methyltransferase [Clostridia bacterium]